MYPDPPLVIEIEDIVLDEETIAVADAETKISCEYKITFFWNCKEVVFSLVGLKKGLTLSTNKVVDPIPTELMIYVDGYIKGNGTYVAPHYRTNPDGNPYNNFGSWR